MSNRNMTIKTFNTIMTLIKYLFVVFILINDLYDKY